VRGVNWVKGVAFLLLAGLFLGYYGLDYWGCTPAPRKEAISPERQKAIEDSLRREREKQMEFEIAKTWSTGYEYFKNESYPDAKKYFLKLLALDPEMKYAAKYRYRDLFTRLATCYIKENKADSAQWAYEMGIKFFPDNAYLHRSLGYILRNKNLLEEAIAEYEKAVELDPGYKPDYQALGDLYIRVDDLDKAIWAFEKLAEIDPEDRRVQETLASLYRTTGREDEALAKKEEILAKNPTDTGLMMELAEAYYRRDENEKVIDVLTKLLELEPKNIKALEYLGGAYLNLEQYTKALRAYNSIIKLEPRNTRILCNIATVYRMIKDFQTAKRYVKRALSIDPKFAYAHMVMAEIYESSAEECINKREGKVTFDDKLVYEKAYKEYRKILNDLEYGDKARARMEAIKGLLPTKEDRFFNPGKEEPTDPCYKWIFQ